MVLSLDCKEVIWFCLSLICWALNVLASSSCSLSISASVSLICASRLFNRSWINSWRPCSWDWPLMGFRWISCVANSFATIWARSGSVSLTVISMNWVLGNARAKYWGNRFIPRAFLVALRRISRFAISAYAAASCWPRNSSLEDGLGSLMAVPIMRVVRAW